MKRAQFENIIAGKVRHLIQLQGILAPYIARDDFSKQRAISELDQNAFFEWIFGNILVRLIDKWAGKIKGGAVRELYCQVRAYLKTSLDGSSYEFTYPL